VRGLRRRALSVCHVVDMTDTAIVANRKP